MSRLAVRVEGSDGRPLHAVRVEVLGHDGQVVVPDGATVLHLERHFGREHHAVADGTFEVDVPPGRTRVTAERGSEFVPAVADVELLDGQRRELRVQPQRWIDQNAHGWFSGDLHGHRDPQDMPRLLASEGLNVGSSIATHNGADQWSHLPSPGWTRTGPRSVFSGNDVEIERLEGGPGALVGVGLRHPLRFAGGAWTPSDVEVAAGIHRQGGVVDAEKPFWPLTPALVALGKVDTIGVACNHFGRTWTYRAVGPIGGIEPEAGIATGADLVEWITGLYHRFLNCGFVLAVSGGSASGWMPNPPGHGRTYVRSGGTAQLRPSRWLRNLVRGHSFATTGPMLTLDVDGHGPGARAPASDTSRRIGATARWWRSLDRLEVLHDGEVVAAGTPVSGSDRRCLAVEVDVPGSAGGWIAARATASRGERTDLAHTSPVWLVGPPPRRRASDAAFLRRWLEHVRDGLHRRDAAVPPSLLDALRTACRVYRRLETTD
jgi:hypothetical protein